jgi:glycogen debranching enzyme
MIDLHFD